MAGWTDAKIASLKQAEGARDKRTGIARGCTCAPVEATGTAARPWSPKRGSTGRKLTAELADLPLDCIPCYRLRKLASSCSA